MTVDFLGRRTSYPNLVRPTAYGALVAALTTIQRLWHAYHRRFSSGYRISAGRLVQNRSAPYVLMALVLSGCGDIKMKWSEQVKLSNGEYIVIARTAKFRENWIPGGGGGSFNEGMTIQFSQPASSKNPTPWEGRFVPILLDRDPDSQEWFIVATFFHCDGWYDLGRPKLPYTEYRYKGGKWIQQPLASKWIGRPANLLSADPSDRSLLAETKPVLMAERKEGLLNNPALVPKFKRVVDSWTTGC